MLLSRVLPFYAHLIGPGVDQGSVADISRDAALEACPRAGAAETRLHSTGGGGPGPRPAP